MSKKLEKAIALDHVRVKNVITGEVKLRVGSREYCLQSGEMLDITSRLKKEGKKSRDALAIPKLGNLVKEGHLLLM